MAVLGPQEPGAILTQLQSILKDPSAVELMTNAVVKFYLSAIRQGRFVNDPAIASGPSDERLDLLPQRLVRVVDLLNERFQLGVSRHGIDVPAQIERKYRILRGIYHEEVGRAAEIAPCRR
jgi:hypothetical protein